jgi:hypothetical protein
VTDTEHEWREERAAILEYDAGIPRAEAEVAARLMWEALCQPSA